MPLHYDADAARTCRQMIHKASADLMNSVDQREDSGDAICPTERKAITDALTAMSLASSHLSFIITRQEMIERGVTAQ